MSIKENNRRFHHNLFKSDSFYIYHENTQNNKVHTATKFLLSLTELPFEFMFLY